MGTLIVLSLVLSGIVLGVFLFTLPKILARTEDHRDFMGRQADLEGRQERLELRWHGTLEELQERLERGTVAFRKARQREAYDSRSSEPAEDLEGEPADPAQEVLELDASGGDPRGLPYVSESMDPAAEPAWRSVARDLASQIAAGGPN